MRFVFCAFQVFVIRLDRSLQPIPQPDISQTATRDMAKTISKSSGRARAQSALRASGATDTTTVRSSAFRRSAGQIKPEPPEGGTPNEMPRALWW